MNSHKVFIDGHVGTTGLTILERLQDREDIEILQIPEEKRKDIATRLEFIREADVSILCLPDEASREIMSQVPAEDRVIDTSTTHRTAEGWDYGFPELKPDFREKIASSARVANPGCYPTGFIAAARPLVEQGLVPPEHPFILTAVSGYSGGGKKMIEYYEDNESDEREGLYHYGIYALGFDHKHLPEMQAVTGLKTEPLFLPAVDHYYRGMMINVPLHSAQLKAYSLDADKIYSLLTDYYRDEDFISVKKPDELDLREGKFLDAMTLADSNCLEICVLSGREQVNITVLLDNLGKGAGGAAIQNMNIMLGCEETSGLL